MEKSTRIVKRLIALSLVLLLSIETFAAVVGDNDGAAFITKAEFDSMKNDFQSQLDRYNSSIDNKIDGAIASYLAGIKFSAKPVDLWANLCASQGGVPLWFMNTPNVSGTYASGYGSSSQINADVTANLERHFTALYSKVRHEFYRASNGWGTIIVDYNVGPNKDQAVANSIMGIKRETSSTEFAEKFSDTWSSSQSTTPTLQNDPTYYYTFSDISSSSLSNSGTAWIYHDRPDGKSTLREYATVYPKQMIDAQYHTYKNYTLGTSVSTYRSNFLAWYVNAGYLGDTSTSTISIPAQVYYGTVTSGTKKTGNNTTSSSTYYKADLNMVKNSNQKDYSLMQWGKSNYTIYALNEFASPQVSGSYTYIYGSTGKFNTILYKTRRDELGEQSVGAATVRYYRNYLRPAGRAIASFVCEPASSYAGEVVMLGGGCPIVEILTPDEPIKISLTFKTRNGSHTAVSGNVYYQLSDKQFMNGALASGAEDFGSGTWAYGTDGKTSVEISIPNPKKGLIWINLYSVTNGYDSTINTMVIK